MVEILINVYPTSVNINYTKPYGRTGLASVAAFLAVLRGGSLSAAARDLNLTQPTLGRQVAALESTLGVPLFARSTEGLQPTERALALRPHAEAMAAAAANLLRAASGSEDALLGAVRLAASEFMGGVVLPPMLAKFRAAYPGVDIETVAERSNRGPVAPRCRSGGAQHRPDPGCPGVTSYW